MANAVEQASEQPPGAASQNQTSPADETKDPISDQEIEALFRDLGGGD